MKKKPQFGSLPPQYGLIVNPYPAQRLSRCPFCEEKTKQRKKPLLIHIKPQHLIALNYTCRYCQDCQLLMVHKHEIEHWLTELFCQHDPETIGNSYLIIGTVERKAWRKGLSKSFSIEEIVPHVSDFAEYYEELRLSLPGYYKADQKPPIMEPPPSEKWVKKCD